MARASLPGGHPYELVLDVAVVVASLGRVFVGAMLETKSERRVMELTGRHEDRLYRLPDASALFREITRPRGQEAPPRRADGLLELDHALERFAEDPEKFRRLVDRDPLVAWVQVMPRAAVLARWGPRGERASRHLTAPQK